MHEYHIARFSCKLHEFLTPLNLLQMRPILGMVLGVLVRRCRWGEREASREDAFRVLSEVIGDELDPVGSDECPAPAGLNRAVDGCDKESLFWRVEIVDLIPSRHSHSRSRNNSMSIE